jgi:hypothetical protein
MKNYFKHVFLIDLPIYLIILGLLGTLWVLEKFGGLKQNLLLILN